MVNMPTLEFKSEIEIIPISHPLHASVNVPGSKSLTNRVLMVAALARGKTLVSNALFSDDSLYFAHALQQLGFDLTLDENRSEMTITGLGGRIPAKEATLYIGNAGTAARFLTAFLTLGEGTFVLDGDQRMRERPIGDLIDALEKLGAQITASDHSLGTENPGSILPTLCPPVRILASGLTGGKAKIAGNISSQFLSGLLMVAPYARNPVELEVATELNSRPYITMTLEVMKDFGVDVKHRDFESFSIQPARYHASPSYLIESDASAASYFFAAPAILGGTLCVENITRASNQGDIAFLEILQKMGCTVKERPEFHGNYRPDYLARGGC